MNALQGFGAFRGLDTRVLPEIRACIWQLPQNTYIPAKCASNGDAGDEGAGAAKTTAVFHGV